MDSIYTKAYDTLGDEPWEGGAYSKILPRERTSVQVYMF